MVQAQVAQAEATLESARALLYAAVGDAWEYACTTGQVPLAPRVRVRMATTFAIQQAALVVDVPYRAAGGTSVFTGNPLEQRFRDIHALTQQAQGNQDHYETVGRFLLGLDPEDPRL